MWGHFTSPKHVVFIREVNYLQVVGGTEDVNLPLKEASVKICCAEVEAARGEDVKGYLK